MNYNKCAQCGHDLHGRADKKFCDHYCRSQFHNQRDRYTNTAIQKVDRILKRNYKILDQLTGDEAIVLPKSVLKRLGFQFDYFTHRLEEAQGLTYNCCYDKAYRVNDEDITIKRGLL